MTEEDVPQVLQIWGDNNLHEGTYTIQSFLRVDPEGFVVAVEDETGIYYFHCFRSFDIFLRRF